MAAHTGSPHLSRAAALAADDALVERLKAGWVPRTEIRQAMHIKTGVRGMLAAWAKEAAYAVEKRITSRKPYRVAYRVRRPAPGEEAGAVLDVVGDGAG